MDQFHRKMMIAEMIGIYDELFNEDITTIEIPEGIDSVFMFDVIEHMPMQVGIDLLRRLPPVFTMISTPSKFFPIALNGHKSLWGRK